MREVTVCKLDPNGRETFRYTGRIVAEGARYAEIEAYFGRPDVALPYVTFRTGDRLIETFYTDRWYNVFALYDVTGGHLKGWYCNITRPAEITPERIAWQDLALDVWVSPAGDVLVLDEDEFATLNLDVETQTAARHAVETIRALAAAGEGPFTVLVG
jgi:predicted RNA-binding protein associated with RNAse of E/G family